MAYGYNNNEFKNDSLLVAIGFFLLMAVLIGLLGPFAIIALFIIIHLVRKIK